jgi:eukaryotic-like serine/threonine-protein kinase
MLNSPEALTVQKVASVQISGKYTNSNAAPLAFKLAGKTCETFVSSKPGEKSRQVEHLSNGNVQLGPAPVTSNPVPGVSINPKGIAVVKPSPTTKPTVTGHPSKTPDPVGNGGGTEEPSTGASSLDTVNPEPPDGTSSGPTSDPSSVEPSTDAPSSLPNVNESEDS